MRWRSVSATACVSSWLPYRIVEFEPVPDTIAGESLADQVFTPGGLQFLYNCVEFGVVVVEGAVVALYIVMHAALMKAQLLHIPPHHTLRKPTRRAVPEPV